MRNWRTVLATTATLASLMATTAATPQGPTDGSPMVLLSQGGDQFHFTVEGRSVKHLYPGATRQLKVTIVNPYRAELRLRSLSGRVVATGRRGCPATSASLQVKDYNGTLPVTIRPRGRITLAGFLPVAMPRGATAKCAGNRFIITLFGTGTKVSR